MSEAINVKQVDTIVGKGLTTKIRTTISAVQGTNSQLYMTISDITYELVKRCHPGMSLNHATFVHVTNKVTQRMHGLYGGGDKGIWRTENKIPSTRASAVYASLKTAYGYRIGVPIAPVINADIVAEKKVHAEAASAVAANPVESILSIIPLLTMAQLTQVSVAILAAKDDKFLELQQAQFNRALDNPRSTKDLIEELENGRVHA